MIILFTSHYLMSYTTYIKEADIVMPCDQFLAKC